MEDKTDETPVTEKEMEDPSAGQRPDAKSYLLSDKAYDVLKWLALIALPALAWFISILGPTWSLPHVDAIVTTLNAVGTLIGIHWWVFSAVSLLIGILIGASTLKSKMTFTV